ncbi:Solute carrier family 46 member 3 [Merluccius polli]|uniref:Solute carrier family 46 member 3 n=1 Tax=Merluccius polli TaxID=89951 RepID=A0AA47LZ75_MERPO|nr:Solute carrier family 46 member 3 [Merluccius polli]
MGCVDPVQPVVAVYSFCFFMTIPLLQQYLYARLWERLSSAPYPSSSSSQNSQCANSSSNLTFTYMEVQKETSLFVLYVELSFLLPSMFSSPLLVACSDSRGRKAAMAPPLLGNLLFSACCFLVSCFSLDLRLLLGAAFLSGLLGGPPALLGGCFAYVADRCGEADRAGGGGVGVVGGGGGGATEGAERGRGSPPDGAAARRRTVSMANVDLIMGVIAGVAPAVTELLIHAVSFSWPFLVAALLHLLNLAYVLLVLRESLVSVKPLASPSSSSSTSSTSSSSSRLRGMMACAGLLRQAVLGQLQSVYMMFVMGSRRRNTALGLTLATFALYKLCKDGGMSLFVLYQLNQPLCWGELLIGCSALLGVVVHLGSFAGVFVFSRCLGDADIVLLGLLSLAAGLLMAAFANTTLLMFLVRVPLVLCDMPSAVLRSMVSHLALSSEQGAVFACVVFLEMVSVCAALVVFNSTYAATVSWFSGFSFLLAALLAVVPAILIGVLKGLRQDSEEDTNSLTAEDADSGTGVVMAYGTVASPPGRRPQSDDDRAQHPAKLPAIAYIRSRCQHWQDLRLDRGDAGAGRSSHFMKWLMTSMGSGKMMVEFFSAAMVLRVCR